MPNTELSEFFSLVSQEKNENKARLKEKISNPESDLANLFEQLEIAHKEITIVSEEISDEKILTEEDQNRLEVFSNLMTTFDSVKEIPEEVKVVRDVELKVIEEPEEVIPEDVVKTDNIIGDIVDALDEMGAKTEVKKEIDQISALRRDFDNFRNLIQRDMSGAGSGEVRLEFLDDVQSSTSKVDGKVLQYSSSDGKWVGATISTTPAADDITAGDAAVNITTTSGNITIDASANNTDIIFKGTDATADITMLTLDGSEAGAAIFNSTITTTGLTLGSTAVTSTAAEINLLDGITAGTAAASKAVILDSNKDLTGVRNLTVAGDLVVSGTTKTVDTVTMEAENAVIFEGATADGNETTLTIVDPTADHTQYLINQTGYIPLLAASTTTAISSTPAELNLLDGSSANSVVNSKAVIYGSSGELAGTLSTAAQANVTSLGTLTALTVDDVAVNGKVITMTGSSSDTAVFTAGTNGTLSIVTTDAAAAAANIQITADGTVDIDSAGVLTLDSGAAINIEPASGSAILLDGTISIDAGVITGATSITSTAFVGDITGDVTGNTSGTAATVTTAAQTNITSLGTLTALTVDNVVINGATIGHGDDTDLMTVADGVLTVAGELDAATLDISGDADIDGTLEADAITVNGTALDEFISDTVGAMVSSNTETGITVTYQDVDNTLDFAIGTLNQDTTGSAATLTTARTIGGVSFDGSANINLPGVNTAGNQNTSGTAAIATTVTITDNESTNENNALIFTAGGDVDGGNLGLESDGTLTYNPSTGKVTATGFIGDLTGDVTGDVTGTADVATVATTVTITDNESTDESNALVFTAGGDVDGGNLGLESDGTLTYNPSTGKITATGFVGTLTGNVTGNTSGTAATVTTAAQTNITSLGTLTALTVDNIIINGTNIGHTSDTDAIAIASNGVVTFSQNPVFPDGGVAIADLDIDGGTDINAALVDADLLIVDDGAGGTNRKTTMARVKTYINAEDDATALAIALG
jgi:hypothetical protein